MKYLCTGTVSVSVDSWLRNVSLSESCLQNPSYTPLSRPEPLGGGRSAAGGGWMIYLLGAATWHLAPRTWQPRLVSLSYGANTAIRVSAWLGRPLATLSWKYEVAPWSINGFLYPPK